MTEEKESAEQPATYQALGVMLNPASNSASVGVSEPLVPMLEATEWGKILALVARRLEEIKVD